MNELTGLYGSGGCGRGLMPILRGELETGAARIVFVDDNAGPNATVNGVDVLTWDAFLAFDASDRSMCLGVADPHTRANLANKCDQAGIPLKGICASNVVIMDDVQIGEGACLSPFVTLTSNIRIGRAFHGNLYSYVEHDCIIGDFVTFAPGVRCNGNIVIEDFAYIGSGAIIRQGKPGSPLVIGRGATIGMGAVVTRDVPAGSTVVGNPAHQLRK
jgi:sugar O-acyltransferase (sialic acid O-acetyltransferase NeuD family)